MVGGREIIAIEGGVEDEATEAGSVRLGKLLAADPVPTGPDSEADVGASAFAAETTPDSGWSVPAASDAATGIWDDSVEETPQIRAEWAEIGLALLAIAGWTGAFVMGNLATMRTSQPLAVWTGMISAWSTPVLVVLVGFLVVRRTSRREAARFGDAARLPVFDPLIVGCRPLQRLNLGMSIENTVGDAVDPVAPVTDLAIRHARQIACKRAAPVPEHVFDGLVGDTSDQKKGIGHFELLYRAPYAVAKEP